MSNPDLSVIVPCYNERNTIDEIVRRVLAADVQGLTHEIVLVDDGSADGTADRIRELSEGHPSIRIELHSVNRGKGAALRTGFESARGNIILIQDADLEYDPADYPKLLAPILSGNADVVYGSRFKTGEAGRVLYFWHSIGNRFLTLLSNMFTNLNMTDMETGYKAFRREVIEKVTIVEDRFGFEPEITAKISRLDPQPRIYEVGIRYFGRTYNEGKKIGWRDGVRAIYCILRYNLQR